jgi:ferrous iron transport protein B
VLELKKTTKRILLCGLPNSGKTSFLNALCKSGFKTANYSGTTVDVKSSSFTFNLGSTPNYCTAEVFDTPGIYTLTSSPVNARDEEIAISFVNQQAQTFDKICLVCDGTILSKEMELAASLMSLTQNKVKIDIIINQKNQNDASLEQLLHFAKQNGLNSIVLNASSTKQARSAIALICGLEPFEANLMPSKNPKESKKSIFKAITHQKIDNILSHSIWGLPIFFTILFTSLFLAFSLGGICSDAVLAIGDKISPVQKGFVSVVTASVINGIFAIFGFIPIIFFVFLFVSLLEKTGYITRVSYLLNGFMLRFFNIDGKAFIPLLTGVGCTVPAYMATRIIVSKHQRFLVNTMLSFIPCSAKNTVFALFCCGLLGSFYGSFALYAIYVFGFAFGLLVIKLISLFISLRGSKLDCKDYSSQFYQIYPLQMPVASDILTLSYLKVKDYITNIATTILMFSVAFSLLNSFGFSWQSGFYIATQNGGEAAGGASCLESIAKFITPIFAPIDLPWQIVAAIIAGFVAKEVSLSMLAVLLSSKVQQGTDIAQVMITTFEPKIIIEFLVFMFFYAPCISAMSTLQKEGRSIRQTLFVFVLTSLLAYGGAYIVSIF